MAKQPRRKCKVCREWFHPVLSNIWWCCPEHGAQYAIQLRICDMQKAEEERLAKSRQAVKPESHFIRQAQQAVNEFIRYRIAKAIHI